MAYNDRKHRTSVQFEYPTRNCPVWVTVLRQVIDILIILAITFAVVMAVIWMLFVGFPGMW